MADRHDYVALAWVKGEIADTLAQVRQDLETLPAAAFEPCLEGLHQVHGSLQMVEFYGAALLAEEMEQLALALQQARVGEPAEALKWLLAAVEQLPLYLDRVHAARRDLPLVVLPLLNELRSARGERLLSETSLFDPPLQLPPALDVNALVELDSAELPGLLRSLRQTWHAALAGLLREQDEPTNLTHLGKVFERLEQLCRNAPISPLWQVAGALVEGMATGIIANSPALRSLFKEADKELKRLIEQGVAGVNQPAPNGLLKSLLFYIAKAEGDCAKMRVIRERYELGDVLNERSLAEEERNRLVGPDRDALHSVMTAVCDELVRVKARLDLFVHGDRSRVDELGSLLPPLRRIADTLAVLGFGQPRKVINNQQTLVQSLAQGLRAPSDAVLMDIAGALLYVESSLAGMAGPPEPAGVDLNRGAPTDLSQIHQLVIKEARFSLQQVKDYILDCIDVGWDPQRLRPLPELLTQIRGALSMIPLDRAASLLQACNECIQAQLLPAQTRPAWEQLDHLADALTAIDYFLERLNKDPQSPGERFLDLAARSLAALGYPGEMAQVPMLDDVLSATELLVLQDMQALDDPQVVHSLAQVLADPVAAPAPDEAAIESQLLEIFRNEALTHLASVDRYLEQAEQHLPLAVSDELQRALHTLKGSASMAGVMPIASLATALDRLAREFKAHLLDFDLDEIYLLQAGETLLRRGLQQLAEHPLAPISGAQALIAQVDQVVSARLVAALSAANSRRLKRDPQLIMTFLAQGMDILLDAESLLKRWQQYPAQRDELSSLLDELTRLGEAAHLADLVAIDDLCEALLDLYGAVEESSLVVSARFFAVVEGAHEALIDMLDQLAAGQEIDARPDQLKALRALLDEGLPPSATGLIRRDADQSLSIRELSAATAQADELDDELVNLFLEEAVDILDSAGQALERWLADPDNGVPLSALQRDLHTLKGGARLAQIGPLGDLGHELEHLYEGLVDRRYSFSPDLARLLRQSHDRLAQMLDQLRNRQSLSAPAALIDAIRAFRQGNGLVSAVEATSDSAPAEAQGNNELLDIFLEEGFDIVESSGAALARWQAEPRNILEVENLLRDLHTLKGGARMVEIAVIGDLAHELEFLYENLSAGLLQPGPELFSLLQNCHDRLAHMLDAVRLRQPVKPATALIDAIRSFNLPPGGQDEQAPRNEPTTEAQANAQASERAPADLVKVAAELLDDLGNLAGETSIFRGRIEQQVNDAQIALNEMETTIERMRDQLRRLDTETQGRILSRQQVDGERAGYEEFDPLEMDRHSQLQQLSRALFESASDLLDLKETLSARNHEAQLLLQQQARVNTDLQEGLMRTRMVPFERLVPRLQRVVRQVASELDKQVEFVVGNAEGEMDRSVLERMVAPLEHMLRNAVDHGLEPREVRLAAGKPAEGRITLNLLHEGSEIIIELADDGAGVPLEAVRKKAIKRGLLDPASDLSDHEVMQFILQPGFSTAQKITQISGRGLGMDVVHEEVKQLGGEMIIDSRPGLGARFLIRLPFTVSVNRALMVQGGAEQYAIPINSIEGIVRVLPNELEAYYQLDPPTYHYAGQRYELLYLGELLQNSPPPKLLGQSLPLPVMLMHSHDQRFAVQVDAVAGSREIVVKSLGPQFAAVPGLSGATILGDGRVVLILDLHAQLRLLQTRRPQQPQAQALAPLQRATPLQGRPLLVMVVDDSVTVRKVTGRLLERNGMTVLTAKDGVDAMTLLQEHLPDVLLLDIEMPRMDGFEVATQIRQDPRLKHLPIIMITSRTGQKHRDRAMAIGVNDYLGKPYQESVLLESIAQWSKTHA
ncbi:Hpt domain-containing protein [Pseudomonas sp. R5(2019)]|uniref:Hpt domain-containing protein n=1 Tax=Pseudomonas sp. R5(2019) TaxID=2697566 RepID=UPI00141285D1|nr:Hpt domain-containing protein [Pseudomonas sp. R5(2019)]NBA96636.1 response regulator [Pseudomonas sp. R5(2019)]